MRSNTLSLSLGLVLLCSVVPACVHAGPQTTESAPAVAGDAKIDTAAADRLDAHFLSSSQAAMRAGYSILISQDGEIVHESYIGSADLEHGVATSDSTRYRLASMTKPLTSTAIMMLFERGELLLTDPVDKYLPEFAEAKVVVGRDPEGELVLSPLNRSITIMDLLTHTSGLGSFDQDMNPIAAELYAANAVEYFSQGTSASNANLLAETPLWFQPGEAWGYGIYSTDILGRVVEVIANEPLSAFLDRELLEPLGMEDTGFLHKDRSVDDLAAMYTHDENGQLSRVDAHPLDTLSAEHGGGGMYSTPRDYLKFASMMLNRGEYNGVRYLSEWSVDMMTANALDSSLLPIEFPVPLPGHAFGLGYGVQDNGLVPAPHSPLRDGDYYWAGSTDTYFYVSPARSVIAIIMTQIQPNPEHTEWRTWDEFTVLSAALFPTTRD